MGANFKFVEEELEEGLRCQYKINEIFHSGKSEFQSVDVVDIEPFGRCLMIDGLIQSSQIDEFVYHECLVHPAMLSHPNPKRVYIGGGGEGSTAREVLKHKSVEKCVMVDIDRDVVHFCREHLPENKEAFNDPRLDLKINCAKAELLKAEEKFDVIIMDLDDPLECGPCYQLYTKEFYELVQSKLTEGGIFVTQSGNAGIKHHGLVWSAIHSTVKSVFPNTVAYNQAVFSFMDEWGWNMALPVGQAMLTPEELDARIKDRITGELKFLDGESFTGIQCLSKKHRETLKKETIVMTDGNHRFMHGKGLVGAN